MARPLRIQFPGAIYHITSRGDRKENIYQNDNDRFMFLEILKTVIDRYNWSCHAYCLMNNHYHLLIETIDANLSEGMRQLNGIYTQDYNRVHQTVGHVFQGRFKSILVEKKSYLLEVSRYIVLNPLRANFVSAVAEWKWSSYLKTSGLSNLPSYICTEWILSQFDSSDITNAQQLYRQYVEEGLEKETPFHNTKNNIILGSDAFVKSVEKYTEDKTAVQEIPSEERFVTRPTLSSLFNAVNTREERADCIYDAHIKYGYRFKEIALQLGIHYSTVSKNFKRIYRKK